MRHIRDCILTLLLVGVLSCTGGGSGTGSSSGGVTSSGTIGGGDISTSSGGASSTSGGGSNGGSTSGSTTQPAVDVGGGGIGSASGTGGGGAGGGGGGGGGVDPQPVPISVAPVTAAGTTRDSRSFTGFTDDNGAAVLGVTVSNTTTFQVVVTASGKGIGATLLDPSANAVVSLINGGNGPQKTSAVLLSTSVNTMPYPSNGSDAAVVDGMYEEDFLMFEGNSVSPLTSFAGVLTAKHDTNLSGGKLRVNVYQVGNDALRTENQLSIAQAIDIWKLIYANIGINLEVQIIDLNIGVGTLPSVETGSSFYLSQTQAQQENALNVFIGSSIAAPPDGPVLGIAPSVPGPNPARTDTGVLTTIKTVVALDLTAHDFEQVNQIIDGAEVGRLAETMAHEAGHYLGLFHPVECSDIFCATGTFDPGDLLGDTPDCSSTAECDATDTLSNLMFPVPPSSIFDPQRILTSSQGRVVNLQVMVD